MKELDINTTTTAQGIFTSLLNIALRHNAAITEQATHALIAMPLKKRDYDKVVKNFKKIHETSTADYKEAIAEYEKLVENID